MPRDPGWNYPSFTFRPLKKQPVLTGYQVSKKAPLKNARLCIHAVVAFAGALDLRLDLLGLAIASRASEELSEVAGSCLGSTDAGAI